MNSIKRLILTCLIVSFPVFADVDTTSSLRGSVNVGGAEVTVTNEATGITKTTTASGNGNFSLSFLPVGGPYTIEVRAPGYGTETVENIYLVLNETTNVSANLVSSSSVEEVVVTAARGEANLRVGTGTTLDRNAMDGIPTISRSIADFAKLDPRVSINTGSARDSEISVMGANSRFNDFSIDGISFNDPFGLNNNGFGTMRNPISMDFVDQISIDVTPFDVSRGNTTGGSIAVVTKSGSNDFHGTYYTTKRDQDNIGKFNDQKFSTFSEEITSWTISGPIIKDKLFLFFGYEEFTGTSPVLYGTKDSGAPNAADTLTTAMANEIANIAKNVYGYDPGEINGVSFPETQEQYTARIDWYINDNHRAVVNVSRSEDVQPQKYNYGSTVFSNNYYIKPPEIDRESFTLYSDWNDRLRTKIKYTTYDMFEDDRSVGDPFFPEAKIVVGEDDVFLGGDRYRGANRIEANSEYWTFKADYDLGEHLLTAGYETEDSDIYNLFIARYNGEVTFNSIEDFAAGRWSYLRFNTPITGVEDVDLAAADFKIEKETFYLQDKWYVNDDLTVILGVRYDQVSTPTEARLNPKFLERNGVPNNAKFDYSKVQPRASFTLNVTDKVAGLFDNIGIGVIDATLRGGYGLFLGRIPNVWFGNQYSRSGGATDYNTFRSFSSVIGVMPAASVADPRFWWVGPTSDYQLRGAYFGDAQGTDPNYEGPSSWRSNIALDYVTEDGYEITFEWNKDDTEKGIFYKDLGLNPTGTTRADGRPVYGSSPGDFWLTNTNLGGAEAFTFSVTKSFGDLKAMFAYSSVEATDVYPLTSAQAESSYGYTQRWDGENLVDRPSNYMIDDKFIFALDYTAQIFGNNDTRFSLIYVAKSGERYSVTFDEVGYNSVGGSNRFYSDYSLAYIPTGASDPNVVFTSPAVAAAVMNHINSTGLANYKGTYAPRNAFQGPDYRRVDLRITQDIGLWKDHKLTVYFDVLNLLNLLDDDKGIVREYSFNNSAQIVLGGSKGYDSQGRYIIAGVDPDDSLNVINYNGQSVWQMNLGFKYSF
jgi:outer membrane receptor for ferrienterochelin and colicin